MTGLAAGFTLMALLLWRPPQRWLVRWRLGGASSAASVVRSSRLPVILAVAGIVSLAGLSSPSMAIAGSTGVGVTWFWWRLRRDARAAAARRRRR